MIIFSRSMLFTLNNDRFTEMSVEARLLYFHLWFSCSLDDGNGDGIVRNPIQIIRKSGLKGENLKELIDNGYVIDKGNGLIKLTDWE